MQGKANQAIPPDSLVSSLRNQTDLVLLLDLVRSLQHDAVLEKESLRRLGKAELGGGPLQDSVEVISVCQEAASQICAGGPLYRSTPRSRIQLNV